MIYPALHVTRDALVAAAIAVDWLARDKRSLSERVLDLPPVVMVKRKLDLKLEDLDSLKDELMRTFPDGERNVLDGEKYLWEDCWVQVRASGTEPIVRILAEARSREHAETLANRAGQAVERSQAHVRSR